MVDIKTKIIDILTKHPEGLTLKDIAKELDVSRITASKYIFELKGEKLITRRRVGSAILHYLSQPLFDGMAVKRKATTS
ncbi:MAG: HTH domain-containing protein [Candidatus Aenigmarchaeota archaeon]|nr:HTH domain-containing protein [Candidatus Aenigmarchaeota archaeon]